MITDPDDVPIMAGALDAKSSHLVTLDTKHFLKDFRVAQKSKLMIVTPGELIKLFKSK